MYNFICLCHFFFIYLISQFYKSCISLLDYFMMIVMKGGQILNTCISVNLSMPFESGYWATAMNGTFP